MSRVCKYCGRTVLLVCSCEVDNCCSCNGEVCLACCINTFPFKTHEETKHSDGILCRRCSRVFIYGCSCCEDAPRDRCSRCCDSFQHLCCRGSKVIFKSPPPAPFFVGPSILPERREFKRLSREDSVAVLTKQVRVNPTQLTRNKFTRYAAVEIEASHIRDARKLNSTVNKWSCAVVRDSSTGPQGFEINTVPACGNALTEQLEELCLALEQGKAQTDEHCGLHVHVDCRDFGYQELQHFIKIYNLIEPALFAAVHPSRLASAYCQPCGTRYYRKFVKGVKPEKRQVAANHVRNISDTKTLKKALIPILYGTTALETNPYGGKTPTFHTSRMDHYGRVNEHRNELRYSAVNLHSYFLRGTIEFRMHHAALNFVEIYGWTKFLVALMDAISKTTNSNIQQFTQMTPGEIGGVKELYGIDVDKDVCVGVLVLSSLLHTKYVAHLVSKIKLIQHIRELYGVDYLPAQLFFNHSVDAEVGMAVAASKLTEV